MNRNKGAFFILVLICLINYADIYAQINLNVKVSASNLLRYGNGIENSVTGDNSKKYFEEIGDLRLFVGDFLLGARYEYDDPIEYGKSYKGITRRFIEFRKDDFTVRAGNFYEIFSKGLTLNSFENRPQGHNTQVDGLKLDYKHTFGRTFKFNGTILGGGIDYVDINDTSRTENYSIRAANFGVTPFKFITIGGSYLFADGKIPVQKTFNQINTEIFEGNLGLNYKGIDLFVSYANKYTMSLTSPQISSPRGDGGYGSITYTTGGLGITFDYKNYRFNLVKPNERSATNQFKSLPFQNAPTCIKEYGSTLLSRFPHNPDFGDEVGFQVDVVYSYKDRLNLNANFSLSSRHYDYKDIDTTAKTSYERIDRSASWMPSMSPEFSPYWEAYFEAEYYFNKNLKAKVGASRKINILYNIVDPVHSDSVTTFTVPVEIQFTFAKIYGVKINAEFQDVFNNQRTAGETKFFSQNTTISLSRSPNIVIAGNFEVTTDKEDPSGKKFWATGEITYKFSSANTITASFGSERGGIKCSSGICRYVNPFNGFRLSVYNNF